jgi:hypothetical protein
VGWGSTLKSAWRRIVQTLGSLAAVVADSSPGSAERAPERSPAHPLPQANWAPAPAYGFTVSAVGSKGLSLSWKTDNDPASIKEYQVSKDHQLVATVTSPTYTDSSGLTCDSLGTCIADYAISVVPKQGPVSVPANVTCTTMYLTPLSCLPVSYTSN